MFDVPRQHAHYLGVASWVLVGVATVNALATEMHGDFVRTR